MRIFVTILLFALCSMLYNCKTTPQKMQDNFDQFYTNKNSLDSLVNILRKSSELDNLIKTKEYPIFKTKDFSSAISKQLQKEGIISIFIFRSDLQKPVVKEFDFTTDWDKNRKIHLRFDSFDSVTDKKGYYLKDTEGNEVWGMDNNWQIWQEVKLTKSKL